MSDDQNHDGSQAIAHRVDWFLQTLVTIVNHADIEIGITLSVGGFLVSGLLIGGAQYFDGFGQEFASAFPDPDVAADMHGLFAKNAEIYRNESPESPQGPPSYIHLKNAKIFHHSGPAVPQNRTVYWRGLLTHVDGFSLGNLA